MCDEVSGRTITCSEKDPKVWDPIGLITNGTATVIMILNQNFENNTAVIIRELWEKAPLRIAVDGGINHLHEMTKDFHSYVPDIICGDFDSVSPNLLDFYSKKGSEIICTPDQNETDFTKALRICFKVVSSRDLQVKGILTLGENGDRLDHTFGNLNTLYLANEMSSIPIYYIGRTTISWLLDSGKHEIVLNEIFQNSHIGLIPLGEPCLNVTTTGLRWNLRNNAMRFGDLVSTSNMVDHTSSVTVENDKKLIWTMEIILKDNGNMFKKVAKL